MRQRDFTGLFHDQARRLRFDLGREDLRDSGARRELHETQPLQQRVPAVAFAAGPAEHADFHDVPLCRANCPIGDRVGSDPDLLEDLQVRGRLLFGAGGCGLAALLRLAHEMLGDLLLSRIVQRACLVNHRGTASLKNRLSERSAAGDPQSRRPPKSASSLRGRQTFRARNAPPDGTVLQGLPANPRAGAIPV